MLLWNTYSDWNNFSLPRADIMLLWDYDFFLLSYFLLSWVQELSWKERTKRIDVFFSEYIVKSIFVICLLLLLLFLLSKIFFNLYHIFIPFSTFGNWRYYFLILWRELLQKSYRKKYLETEHMGESFRRSLVHCKKRFWTCLGICSPWENVLKGTQVSDWLYWIFYSYV